MLRRGFYIGLLASVLTASLWGQSGNATVTGQVTDGTAAIISGATVAIQNKATNVVQTTRTNTDGRYSIPGLIPGTYALTAEFAGFKRFERPNLVLQVGDHIALDVMLQVGAASDSVTVTAEVPLLRTEDAQQGMVIDNKRIQELPQYNRNPLAFAQLAPNVNGSAEQSGKWNDFRINGGRTGQTEYFIDGVPTATGYEHDVPPSVPGMEAVGEFKVVSNGLSAEYGRLSGGVVVLATKSGTNEFHGNAYEFFRNNVLNANDWNSNRYGVATGAFHDNIFGGSLGGPVRIPKVYNGKDKTFFFLNYEGLRNSSGNNATTADVPTDLERKGDFSQTLFNGAPAQIYDWTTGKTVNGQLQRQLFAGNVIPETMIDPLAKIYAGFYPEPNQAPRAGTNNQSNYLYTSTTTNKNAKWSGRLDENWSNSNTTHFSLTRFDSDQGQSGAFSKMQALNTSYVGSTTGTLEHVWTISPTTIFTGRLGLTRYNYGNLSGVDPSIDDSTWPIQDLARSLLGTTKNRVPGLGTYGGVTGLGGGGVSITNQTDYSASGDLQKLVGKHTFKFGFSHQRYYLNQYSGGSYSAAAGNMVTASDPSNQYTGAPFASFLLGRPTWGDGTQFAGPASLQTAWGAYAQDDFKVTKKLSLNLGVRWDFEPSRTERYDRQTFWDPNYTWNVTPDAGWSWDLVRQEVGDPNLPVPQWLTSGIKGRVAAMGTADYPGRTLVQDHAHRFSPRAGVAYQFAPRTVVRGSYGINWLTVNGNEFINSAIWNVGFGDSARMAQDGTSDGGLTYPLSFSTPFPNGAGYVPFTKDVNALNRSVMGNWWMSETPRFSEGYEHAVQLSVQREFGSAANSWVVEVNYSGNFGRNLPYWAGKGEHILPDAYHIIGPLGSKLLQPVSNPFYGLIPYGTSRGGQQVNLGMLYELNPLWQQISTTGDPMGTSNYNAGYIQVQHKFGHGFGLLASYTLSKLMQDVGGSNQEYTSGFPQAGLGPGDVYGIAPTDQRHKLLFNYSIDLPFGHGKALLGAPQTMAAKVVDKVVGGWTMAGTTTFHGGTPLDVIGNDRTWWNAGQANNDGVSVRPIFVNNNFDNHVSGHTALEGAPGYTPYLNASSFRTAKALPSLMEIGNVGSVLPVRGPGFSQWDFSMLKNITLGKETRNLQLRFEAQNVLNHMNAGNPGDYFTDAVNFGKITWQNGNPRRVMVSAKFSF